MKNTIRYLFDEHISTAIADGLHRRGINVSTLKEVGKLGAADEEIFAFAHKNHFVVVTHDSDFLRLASFTTNHSGVVYGTQNISIGEMVRKLTVIHQVLSAEEIYGHIEFL